MISILKQYTIDFKSKKANILKMTTHIDLRTLPASIPSLCIPRVFHNIDEKRIRRIFDDLALGEIQAIDFVSKKTEKGESFNRVFVHFRRWFVNKNADTARERLLEGKEIKIIYDEPWFWKVSAYRPPVQAAPRPLLKAPRPHIEFDSEEDRPSQRPQERPRFQERPRPQERPSQRPSQSPQENRKAASDSNDEFGRDRTLRQEVPQTPAPKKQAATEFVAIPSQVARRRINKNTNKKPLKIEEAAPAANLEDGEVEE